MKIKEESFTIVLIGNWNRHILSPNWISKEIFLEDKITVEFSLNLELPPRYTSPTSHIRILPSSSNVTFVALGSDDSCLNKMEKMTQALLEKLPYTPIKAFGINFGYIESIEKSDLYNIFKFSDTDRLGQERYLIKSSALQRSLIVEDRVLNLNISTNDTEVSFDFNFHYDVSNAKDAIDKITSNAVTNKIIAEKILSNVYKLSFDSVAEETQ